MQVARAPNWLKFLERPLSQARWRKSSELRPWYQLVPPRPALIPAPQPALPQYGPLATNAEGTLLAEHLKTAAVIAGCILLGIVAVELVPAGALAVGAARLIIIGAGAMKHAVAAPTSKKEK
jgi:hypothetical protein